MSYSFGFCKKKQIWYILSPAPTSLKITEKPLSIVIDHENLDLNCKSSKFSFISSSGGRAQKFSSSLDKIYLKPFGPGYFSISCKPKYLKSIGHALWYLFPIKKAYKLFPPFIEKKNIPISKNNFLKWINKIRVKEGLTKLVIFNNSANHNIEALNSDFTIVHDINKLNRLKEYLKKQMILLGENRVIARGFLEMIHNLWTSPSHRDFFLDPLARKLSIVIEQRGNTHLAVFLLGI